MYWFTCYAELKGNRNDPEKPQLFRMRIKKVGGGNLKVLELS